MSKKISFAFVTTFLLVLTAQVASACGTGGCSYTGGGVEVYSGSFGYGGEVSVVNQGWVDIKAPFGAGEVTASGGWQSVSEGAEYQEAGGGYWGNWNAWEEHGSSSVEEGEGDL